MRFCFFILVVFSAFIYKAQNNLYRFYPQGTSSFQYCEIQDIQKTFDNGYLMSFFPFSVGLHGGPYNSYTIKTDSNFIPEWKRAGERKAIILPTGGIILFSVANGMVIEKITKSGVQVWVKQILPNSYLFDGDPALLNGVSYNDKIRFVGYRFNMYSYPMNKPYSLEMDTMGNFVSHAVFVHPTSPNCVFENIIKDSQGNFLVWGSQFTLAKFDSNFNPLWVKTSTSASEPVLLTNVDFLPGGRMIATGRLRQAPYGYLSALLKLDSQGNLIGQKTFDRRDKITGLCKKSNSNYIVSVSTNNQDSLFIFETDTSLNILWNKLFTKNISIGTSIIKGNTLYTPIFQGTSPVLVSSDLNGNNCRSNDISYTPLSPTRSLTTIYFTPSSITTSVATANYNYMYTQTFLDSCNCNLTAPLITQSGFQSVCAGQTITLSAIGTGSIYWYSSPFNTIPLSSGTTFTYSSPSQTVITLYLQDSLCIPNSLRSTVTVTVNPNPVLLCSPSSTQICKGSFANISVSGSNTYTWISLQSPYTNGNFITVNPNSSTVYTVTGTNTQNGCQGSSTINVVVNQNPTVTINGNMSSFPSTICLGDSLQLLAGGALSYTWNTGASSTSIAVSPTVNTLFMVIGTNSNNCASSASLTQNVSQCTSLKAKEIENLVMITPNPNHGNFTITMSAYKEYTSLEIVNSCGQLLLTQNISEESTNVNLTYLAAGVYYLKLNGQKETRIFKLVRY